MIRDPRGFDQGRPRWCHDLRLRTVDVVDLSAPPADSEPLPPSSAPTPPRTVPPDRIVGGVAALIGQRLGLDPLWVRVAFVLLALAGGIGVIVYGGLWLMLVAGERYDAGVARIIGGIVLVIGVPIVLNSGDFEFLSGPLAVILLLIGLALALWQPRRQQWPVAAVPAAPNAITRPDPVIVDPENTEVPPRAPRAPREPASPLGRAVLGLAIAVAALGALIDQANGGRLHPEQWLGAAAVVCGVGLLVAAFVGRGRWLVVPALLFAAVGYGAGHVARLGIPMSDMFGDQQIYVADGSPGGTANIQTGIGNVDINIDGVPRETLTVDARAGIGTIHVFAASDVAVMIRPRVDEGDVRVNGREIDGAVQIGPSERDPDVIVDARVGRGDVEVTTYDMPIEIREPEIPRPPVDIGTIQPVAEFVGVTDDGWFVLADGSAVIDADDTVLVGETYEEQRGVTVIVTNAGEFRLLPRGLLLTPWSQVLDLHAIRESVGVTPTTTPVTTTPATTVPPSTTTPATTVPTSTTVPATPTTGGNP